jgi:hypothetical protein
MDCFPEDPQRVPERCLSEDWGASRRRWHAAAAAGAGSSRPWCTTRVRTRREKLGRKRGDVGRGEEDAVGRGQVQGLVVNCQLLQLLPRTLIPRFFCTATGTYFPLTATASPAVPPCTPSAICFQSLSPAQAHTRPVSRTASPGRQGGRYR